MTPHSKGIPNTTDAPALTLLVDALRAFEVADLPHCLRNGALSVPGPGEDIDVLVPSARVPDVAPALAPLGWQHVRAPGHRGHEFFVQVAATGRWLKLDVVSERRYGSSTEPVDEVVARRRHEHGHWVTSEVDEARHRAERAAGRREVATLVERVRRALPVAARRRGVVIALLGPDGAGKGTTIAAVADGLPVAHSVVYLGDRRASAVDAARRSGNEAAQPQSPDPCPPVSAQGHRRSAGPGLAARETLFLLRKWAVLQPRILKAYWLAWGGHVVLCDRHPLDAVAVRPKRTRTGVRVERVLAQLLTPHPDAVVVLDAPGEVLWARKHEHTPEVLEQWRQGYRSLPGAEVIDTSRDIATTVAAVSLVVWSTLLRRWSTLV